MTRRAITLKAPPAFKQKYQSLLRKDWSMVTLRQVLKLLDELLRASGATLRFAMESSDALPLGGAVDAGLESAWEESEHAVRNGKIVFGLIDLMQLLTIHERNGLPGMPALPESLIELLSTSNRTVTLAVLTWVYLDLPWLFNLGGETGLFRDLESILFLNAVESLLPELRGAGLDQIHSIIVHALGYHSAMVWRDDPAQQQYLLSALARYLGDRDLEENALRSAFRLTDPNEHDYLTLAQSYWQFLSENQRHEDAETFLLDVYRQAPQEQLVEIKEMIDETFAGRFPARA